MDCDSEWQKMMSLRLSSVLDDIGVTQTMIRKTRRTFMTIEKMFTINARLIKNSLELSYVGSKIEGTTTIGLDSDRDANIKFPTYIVIESMSEFCPGRINLLMIKNENTASQFCCLQRVGIDVAAPAEVQLTSTDVKDQYGRVLMTHAEIDEPMKKAFKKVITHGPSRSMVDDIDLVFKFPCLKLPDECKYVSRRPRPGHWPLPETIQKIGNCESCVIPQGSHYSANPKIEWCFSTSQMERILMFDLNLVQIKVYVTLKILKKSFIQPLLGDRLTSYHMKTAVLFTVENYNSEVWTDRNIVACVILCFKTLLRWARQYYMPHYFISDGAANSANPKIEWRLSTSQMQRILMFDLNPLQIKVYVLLKILIKSFIEPLLGDRLSSFHLKTAVLFTVENYNLDVWTDINIVIQMNDYNQKQVALQNLALYVMSNDTDGGHHETAVNMLGHCYEMENKPVMAMHV
ncbi:uncharacterized protein LOC128208525 [Mya arenaria]|uniref:uncharacterized protein LOC128208525 n=1 Tax=Mya arenaria TaxID=6604 RepID=UPI0022E93F37|nr:uncharacterized protein LOC128208525 [Mya arenaria]